MSQNNTLKKIVLVTGATGQLGRQVVRAFQTEEGWEVVGTGTATLPKFDSFRTDSLRNI